MKTRIVRLVTIILVAAAASCAKDEPAADIAGKIEQHGALPATSAPDESPLDLLASHVTGDAELACVAPRGPAKKGNELAARAAFHCSNTKESGNTPSDTLVLISRDASEHALTVARLWLPNTTARAEYEALQKELTASLGPPVACASPNRGTYWRANGLDVSIDTMYAGGALRWRVSLAAGPSACESIS